MTSGAGGGELLWPELARSPQLTPPLDSCGSNDDDVSSTALTVCRLATDSTGPLGGGLYASSLAHALLDASGAAGLSSLRSTKF